MAINNIDLTIARDAISKIGDPNLKAALEALYSLTLKTYEASNGVFSTLHVTSTSIFDDTLTASEVSTPEVDVSLAYNFNGNKILDDTELTFGTTELNQTALVIDGTQVVGVQQPVIPDPTGGGTVDTESRAAIVLMLAAMEAHGLIAT